MRREYFRVFSDLDRIRCLFDCVRGRILEFVVQYELRHQEHWFPVVRYDTSHGIVHRDVSAPDGSVVKSWFPGMSFDEGLRLGYNDIVSNWEKYRSRFYAELGS